MAFYFQGVLVPASSGLFLDHVLPDYRQSHLLQPIASHRQCQGQLQPVHRVSRRYNM